VRILERTHRMTDKKSIEKRYGVDCSPNRSGNGGFVGTYAIPGKDLQYARDEAGVISVFATEDEAIAAAGEEMCRALNGRTKFSYRHGYKRLGGAQLAVGLKELEISPANFAAFFGTSQKRVLQWIDGEEDVPHSAHLLLTVLAVPGMKTLVQQFTNATMIEKSDEKLEKDGRANG